MSQEDGTAGGDVVRFEIESGPAARGGCTVNPDDTCTGGTALDSAATPTSPDLTCTTDATNTCSVRFTSDTAGTNVVRAWVDDDQDPATFDNDADTTEGRDEATAAGQIDIEPDDTDVVEKTWFGAAPAGAQLDCDDESGDDTQTNPLGQTETYTCTVTANDGADADTARDPVQGAVIDVEQSGANDPDNTGFGVDSTADRNDACTTAANGTCQVQIPAQDNEAGTGEICFWLDSDTDTQFDWDGAELDGGGCNGEAVADAENDDVTDRVQKTWAAPAATTLDAEPEVDNNASGTSHSVTATVLDQFGNGVAGAQVDFVITGRNASTPCDNVITNASGQVTCTYNDAGTATTSGQDTINVCVNGNCTGEARDVTDADLEDTVTKFWTAGGPPAAAAVIIDMDGTGGSGGAEDCTDDPTATANEVDDTHLICADVDATGGAAIPGAEVTFTTDLGHFTNAAGDDLGQSFTTTADENGEAFATLTSTETGTANVEASSGSASDTGTKQFTAAEERNIACDPATATNPTGTQHVITCTVTDLFGNPVPGVSVTATETGAGRLVTTSPQVTNAAGQVEFVTETTEGEAGEQSLEFEITSGRGAGATDDECEQAAGTTVDAQQDNADATTAGNCKDTAAKTWSDEATTPPGGFPRTVTLEASRNRVVYGNQVTLTASVSSTDANTPDSCLNGVTVTFQHTIVGSETSEVVGTATTDANGVAELSFAGDRSGVYTASVEGNDTCAAATSGGEPVNVKKKVKLRVSDQTPRRGTRVAFRVTVLPCGGADGPGHEGDRVQLYKTVGGQLAKIDAKRTNDECKATFRKRARGSNTYQARSPKQDADHLGGKSRKKAVIAH